MRATELNQLTPPLCHQGALTARIPDKPARNKIAQRGGGRAEQREARRNGDNLAEGGRPAEQAAGEPDRRHDLEQSRERADPGTACRRMGKAPRTKAVARAIKRWQRHFALFVARSPTLPYSAASICAGRRDAMPERSGSARRRISVSSRATSSARSPSSRWNADNCRNAASPTTPEPRSKIGRAH